MEVTPRVPLEKHHQLCMCASAPIVSDSLRPHGQRSLSGSMGFSRQECWSELPCPCPGDLPDSGIKTTSLMSPAMTGGFFTTSATWEAICCAVLYLVAQSCLTLCDPMDYSLLGSFVHGDSPDKNTGVGCYALPPGDLPNPGIDPPSLMSPALAVGFFIISSTWEALKVAVG